jgi:DNA-binding beta-propeller fold protein YncE
MHTSAGSSDMYLAKLSATGDPIWVRTPGGTGNGSFGQDEIRAIALDSAGNCYVTGTYNTDARFDTISLASTLTFEAFIAKYDSAGRALWARSGGGFGAFHTPLGIAVNAAGDCYVTGSFFNYLVFGADTLDAVDAEQKSFIVKLDRDGDVIWAEKIGTGGYYGAGQDVALDRDGNAYVTGQFRATISFGTKEHSYFNQLKYAVLVVKYDRDGHYVWSTQSDGPDQAAGALRICVDADGNLYTVGSFSADIRFGATQLTGLQGNAFIAKLDPQGNWVQAEQISGPGSVTGSALAITPDGDCEVIGTFSDSIALGATTLRSSGGLDMFLARLGGNPSGVELPSPQPASALVLSPNPVANLLQLRGIGKPDRIEIFSIEGIRVLDAPANDPLDVSGLAPGMYMVKAGKRLAKR